MLLFRPDVVSRSGLVEQLIESVRDTPPYVYFGDLAPGKCLHALKCKCIWYKYLNSAN